MSRHDAQRLEDIAAAITAIHAHLGRGDLTDPLMFDAVRMRLIEIGEAVKALAPETTSLEPSVPWSQIAGMRDRLAHRYFESQVGIIRATVLQDLPPFAEAVARLRARTPEA